MYQIQTIYERWLHTFEFRLVSLVPFVVNRTEPRKLDIIDIGVYNYTR